MPEASCREAVSINSIFSSLPCIVSEVKVHPAGGYIEGERVAAHVAECIVECIVAVAAVQAATPLQLSQGSCHGCNESTQTLMRNCEHHKERRPSHLSAFLPACH